MQDPVDRVLPENCVQKVAVSNIAVVELDGGCQILPNARREVVDDHDLVACIEEAINGMTADIPSTSCDQHS